MNEKNNKQKVKDFVVKNKKVLIILFILIILLVIFFAFKFHDARTKNGTTVDLGQVILVKNRFAEYDVKSNSIEKDVIVQDAYNEKVSKKFMKINMTITNTDDNVVDFSGIGFNGFAVENSSGKKVGSCSMLDSVSYKTDDAIPYMVEAGKVETGYLYCDLNSEADEKLKLVVSTVTQIDMDAYKNKGQIKSIASEFFYINLYN